MTECKVTQPFSRKCKYRTKTVEAYSSMSDDRAFSKLDLSNMQRRLKRRSRRNYGWPIRCADRLSVNRLLSIAALEEANFSLGDVSVHVCLMLNI